MLCLLNCDEKVVEDHAPSSRWRVDTLISMLGIAGAECDRSVPSLAVVYVTQNEALHAHAAHKTFRMLQVRQCDAVIFHLRYFEP